MSLGSPTLPCLSLCVCVCVGMGLVTTLLAPCSTCTPAFSQLLTSFSLYTCHPSAHQPSRISTPGSSPTCCQMIVVLFRSCCSCVFVPCSLLFFPCSAGSLHSCLPACLPNSPSLPLLHPAGCAPAPSFPPTIISGHPSQHLHPPPLQ